MDKKRGKALNFQSQGRKFDGSQQKLAIFLLPFMRYEDLCYIYSASNGHTLIDSFLPAVRIYQIKPI